MKKAESNSLPLTGYTTGRGHSIFVPASELAEFRNFLAHFTPEERVRYAPISEATERPAEGGVVFTFGSERSHDEIMQLCARFIVRA